MTDIQHDNGPRQGPPWIDPEIQQKIAWRDGDVVISVPPKSGTTWTMNIVHQVLNGGTAAFERIYEEVPWIEFLSHPADTHDTVLDRLNAIPPSQRRVMKTHSPPPGLPFHAPDGWPGVKYIVVFRNPEESLVSFWPFLNKHSDEWFDLWQVPRMAMCRPDFPSFYAEVIDPQGMQAMHFGFLAAWWPLRGQPNVLFLHYADMKDDHEGTIRKIADFLGVSPGDDRWPAILEYTSFPWMKQHEDRFETMPDTPVPVLNPGAMLRRGEAGKARDDGMTDEISRHLRAVGSQICPDADALDWLYNGGPLP
ncbi:sulfotransferase domain-containing protein [Limimaricola sp.]|uniref:sulfotransferase domain-containing protein n=1 Tax=Limimaricola sp. TaxID=2211665 RepID=UPI0025B7D0BC|nr:sulfotransferase domain-containing protein [Limimaricola sp.]